MSDQTIAHLLISSVAIGGISLFWRQFTAIVARKVAHLANEMFADKGAEERKRQKNTRRSKKKTRTNTKKRRSSSKRRRRGRTDRLN